MFKNRHSFTRYDAKIAAPNNYNTECRVLIENGDLDQEVPKDTIVEPLALWIFVDPCGYLGFLGGHGDILLVQSEH